MAKTLLDQTIDTDYGQFSLEWGNETWDGDSERVFADQQNGWVGAAVPGLVHIVLARRSGGSSVRIEALEEEPPHDSSWEDCVEVSMEVQIGAVVRWVTWAGQESGELDIFDGSYRLRVCARGRDAGQAGEFEPGVVDFYLVQLWPSPARQDAVLRVGSLDAAYWHAEWGSRR